MRLWTCAASFHRPGYSNMRPLQQSQANADGKSSFNTHTSKEVGPAAYSNGLPKSHNKLVNIKCIIMKLFPIAEATYWNQMWLLYWCRGIPESLISFQHVLQNGRHLEKIHPGCCEGKLHLGKTRLLSCYCTHVNGCNKEIHKYTHCSFLNKPAKWVVSGSEKYKSLAQQMTGLIDRAAYVFGLKWKVSSSGMSLFCLWRNYSEKWRHRC